MRHRPAYIWTISLNVMVFGAFILAGTFMVKFVNDHAYEHAIEEARRKADIHITHNLMVHSYLNNELKPSVLDLTEGYRSKDYFEPRWMSSTYAVREIDRLFKGAGEFTNYYYKEAAINARSPYNEADAIEREFLARLNSDKELDMESGVREIAGQKYFVVMKRGESMKEDCLMCHSTPEEAPAELVKYYGPDRSFGRHSGQLVSALSIRIPFSEALDRAGEISGGLKRVLLVVLGVLLVTQVYVTQRLLRGNELLSSEVEERKATESRLMEALEEKDVLMREVHHRVKNSLAVIQSLLNLQSHGLEDEQSRASLLEAQCRVKSMSMIYERLQLSHDVHSIDASEYIRSLVNMLYEGGRPVGGQVSLSVDIADVPIDIDTLIPLGLIINELFSNAFKYAFPDNRHGNIFFGLECHDRQNCTLRFVDDGVGIPEGFDIEGLHSLGMTIIRALVRQIGGRLSMVRDNGTRAEIAFPRIRP